MFKKIALYLLLFVVVSLATAGGVVLFNKKPKSSVVDVQTQTEESSVLSSVVSAAMNIENYNGKISILSSDNDIDISGTFLVFDISKKPSADISLSGKLLGNETSIRVKYKNDYLYAKYNDFGVKIKAADLTDSKFINEIVSTVSMFVETQDAGVSFDVDAILASLANIESKETKEGFSLQINLPGIGDIYAETDKNYIPTFVSAKNIALMGKTISFSLEGKTESGAEVSLTSAEINSYIDISESKELIVSLSKTIKNFPVELTGDISLFGQKINAKLTIDKNFNIFAVVDFGNITANLTYYKNQLYADVCGLKLKGTANDLSALFSTSTAVDVNKLLKTFSLNSNSLSLAGTKLLFEYDAQSVSNIKIEHELFDGDFDLSYGTAGEISKPAGFVSAMSFAKAKEVIESYAGILLSNQISFRATGKINSNINFNLASYIKHDNFMPQEVYVGGEIISKPIYAYYKDGNTYISADGTKVKFSNSFLGDVIEYVSSTIGAQMPNVDFGELAKEQVSKLLIDKDGNVQIELACGLAITVSSVGENKEIVLKGSAFKTEFDCTITIYGRGNYFELAYKMLNPDLYSDISYLSSTIKSVAKTLTCDKSCFKGNVNVDLLGIINLNIGVELEIGNVTKGLDIKLKLTSLPSTCLITDTNRFKYSSQTVIFEFSGNSVVVKRYGVTKKKQDLRFEKTYNINQLTANDVFDMFGIGGMFGNKIKNSVAGASSSQPSNSNIKDIVGLLKTENGLLAQLNKSALPSALKMVNVWFDTADGELNSINAFLLTNKSLVRVKMCLKKV